MFLLLMCMLLHPLLGVLDPIQLAYGADAIQAVAHFAEAHPWPARCVDAKTAQLRDVLAANPHSLQALHPYRSRGKLQGMGDFKFILACSPSGTNKQRNTSMHIVRVCNDACAINNQPSFGHGGALRQKLLQNAIGAKYASLTQTMAIMQLNCKMWCRYLMTCVDLMCGSTKQQPVCDIRSGEVSRT